MVLVTPEHFVGRIELARSTKIDTVLEEYIERFEAKFIRQILGVELGNLLIADVQAESGSDPIEERFTNIIEPFQIQEDCSPIHESAGLIDVIASMIFFHYVTDRQVLQSQSGAKRAAAEASVILTPREAQRQGESVWNEALSSIEAIQWRCSVHEYDTYPEFMGVRIPPQYSSLL